MRKFSMLLAIVFMLAALCGCDIIGMPKDTAGETEENASEEASTMVPETETSTQPFLSIDEVINYFCEVVLKTEYSNGVGDATLVQKWADKICYRIYGEATEQDKRVLTGFIEQLNEIDGFPGIVPAGENDLTDLAIYFYDYEKFNQSFGEFLNYELADGAVQYWYYTDTNVIYDARIGYRTDIDQYTRNSVILEEIFNGLGITDTVLREDSIAYQGFSQPQELSEIDWLMIKLLYHPKMKAGMNREECVKVIREIYPFK